MGLLGAIGFSLAFVSLIQIHHSAAASSECKILSASPSSATSVLVKWEQYPKGTGYLLDLRKINSSDTAPIVVSANPQTTELNVHGLSPGQEYKVTLKVFAFYFVECVTSVTVGTVPDTAQILDARALTSSSITVTWSTVPSAQHYYLQVVSQATGNMLNFTYTNTSAVVRNLQPSTNYDCYIFTANNAGRGSRSKVRTVTTFVQPPVGIKAVQTQLDTARVTWEPVKDVLLYRFVMVDTDNPASRPFMYNVTGTRVDVRGILPCSNYRISVSSFNKFLVPSEPTDHTYSTNKLTPVSSVSVDYTCTTNAVIVSWSTVLGAESYMATVMDGNSTRLSCTSQGSSCQVSGLSCGQNYVVHVTPMSQNCRNLVNATSATFQTVPCPPNNLTLSRECSSNVIIFSWNHTSNTDYYLATAIDSKGEVKRCLTTENSCYFTHSRCGHNYSFTVSSASGDCTSETSDMVDIRTAPCMPQNLQTSAMCSSDDLLSTWDHAEGAKYYTVHALGNYNNSSYSCTSVSNSCVMEGISCGENLSINITAYDDECSSPPMLGLSAETVPCAPQNVTVAKKCGDDSIRVNWTMNSGALFYVTTARDSDGVVHSCNSMDMLCVLDGLKCGTNYKVHVIASNFMCNSTESEVVTVETAACPPGNLSATLDCVANEALISWQGQPNMNSYTATIVDAGQGLLSCSSTTTSCKVPNLKCGQKYTVTVSHHDGICPSMPSKPIYMDSVPCGPANLHANVDCTTGGVTISWNASKTAEGYTIKILGSNEEMIYNVTDTKLSLNTLQCGQEYTVRLRSYNGSCPSRPSEIRFKEAPCVPVNVTAKRDCHQNFVDVMWQASRGAKNYTAIAIDKDGNRQKCVSNGTSCRLEDVACSQVYNITVVAVDDACTSAKSATVKLTTEPCPPTQLTASINCTGNSAKLTWTGSLNAASYTGKAVSTDGHNVSCDARLNLGCYLDGLHCGKKYTFTVSASGGNCESPDSVPVIRTTAPCAVQNVITTLNCSADTLTISWTPGSMPVNYSATAVTASGMSLSCLTEGSSCKITNLQCGQQYTVAVKPISSTCEGKRSVPEIVNSVPCVPMNVQGTVECSTNTVKASWGATAGAASYVTVLKGEGGFSADCHTVNNSCTFPHLQCAQTYMFSVVALNDRCNSSKSATISATTAPCDPTNVSASLNCLSGVATVMWRASAGANDYTVVAEAGGNVDSCKTTGTSCELTKLQCGEDYTVTVLAGDAKCNSSILAKTNITTAPCAPVIKNHSLDCASNHAIVTWHKDEDAMSVTVNATSSRGHSYSCSSSSNSSCVLDQLMCGHTYTVRAVARGVQCLSKASSSFQIVTAPCTPANVEYQYSCETSIAFVSWDEALGRKSFYVYAQSGDSMVSCNTSETYCSLPSLLCGRTFDVKVIAVADQCNSSMPGVTWIHTAPCAPMNVSASLVCNNNTAEVSWKPSPGAVSYNVTATARNGDIKRCSTNGTTCQLPNMHCAQTYIITVSPFSKKCKGYDSFPYTYIAGPCPPTNVNVALQCVGNVGHVTWNAALYADLYEVTTIPSITDQHAHTCSSNTTNCPLTDLHCGETLAVTVVTVERGCRSKPSVPFIFQSVICPPMGVAGVTTCSNNDITVRWDPSPESGVNYFVYSQEYNGTVANYSTARTSHVISGLQCSQKYMFKVAARDSDCTSLSSKQIETETAPCPPTNLTVRTECGTNLAILSWAPSKFAISYVAKVTGTHGQVVSCFSNTTTCSVKVDCGRQYSAVVVASTATCNSSASASLNYVSAPCLPDRVQAELDCNANSFAVQWRGSVGDIGMYTAIAIGSDESRQTCDTHTTNCTIQNVKCGLLYSIVVTTASVDCGTIEGSNYKMHSAPCKPKNVSVNLQCSTNVASVTWGNSGPDQTQVVTAVDMRGGVVTCNSSSSNCTFDQLTCGKQYTISVTGHTNTCSSEPALARQLNTAPCMPTHLTARVDCQTGITVVTWDAALGATSYTVYARGSLGHNAVCNSTDTNCDFSNLACGQDYNISVLARHNTCVSLISKSIIATTGPCPHSGLKTALVCETNRAVVSWTPGSGILYYNASADAFNINHKQTCSTNSSTCNISSLQCGESYKVSVSGQGQNCPSPAQSWHRINTAPCPPTNLTINSSCTSNNISVSWLASKGSLSYMAVAENAQGQRWSCNTSSTTCQIANLLCGQQYKVYVSGIDEKCMGAKSEIKMIRTAPCVPNNIQNHLDCLSGVLNVTWESTGYYVKFRASVRSSSGHESVCSTDKHHCVVRNLQCGLTYDVKVVAQDDACNSSHSPIKQVHTAPCPLSSFVPTVNCSTGVVSVTWSSSVAGVLYTVSAVDAVGHKHNCSSKMSGCNLSSLECGTEYNVTITPSRNGCVGRDSSTEMITTVPCVPQLSEVEIDCLTNSAWVMYEESAGAENYVVVATDSLGNDETFECNATSDGMCALPPLTCSQNLTFTLMAHDQQCTSAPSNAITAETAPCPPEGVQESVSCDNGTITVSWSAVPGAVTYTATLEELYGNSTTCCTTSDSSCDITDLPCEQMYILHVMAEGRTCNSSQSNGIIARTAPCVPDTPTASLSCSNNVASVSWSNGRLGQLYLVQAVSADGHVDMCDSPANQCDLTSLHCGQYYTATVTAEDMVCKSKPSQSVTIKTVPCTPANASSEMDCEANALIASWSEGAGADSYIATLEDSSGHSTTCQGTTEGSCSVTGLGCGQIYHVSVVSSDGYCNSPPTPVVDTPSAPCEPRNIKALMDCYTDTAMVTWYPSTGALSYVTIVTTASGHNVTCESNTTSCEMEGLLCGETYSVSVEAVGETCSSVRHMAGHLVTGPCIPEHITTQYSVTIGQVQWDMTAGADYYTVRGETDQGLMVSCSTNDTYCALYNMVCGQMYNIKVTAHNHVCRDLATSTEPVTIMTEPCPPKNVETNVNCQDGEGTVSWEGSSVAVGYQAQLAGRDGHSLSCYTNETFCNVQGLHCGVIYHTSVFAVGRTANSSSSVTVLLVAAPCEATNVAATLDCDNNTAEVTWSPASGANSYLVTAVATDGYQDSCETDEHQCDLMALHCGQMYTVTVTTIGEHCRTETHTNVTFSSRPCKPMRVGADMRCGTSTAVMYWEEEEGVELYMATATCSMGMTVECNSTNSTCRFSNLQCGKTYELSVAAYSNMCYSEISSTVEIQTEPCQPTGLTASGSCQNDTVMLDWYEARGALLYVVTVTGDLGYSDSFQTNDTTIETDLPCGQLFTFTVVAQDNVCDSPVSLPDQFKTGPCIPLHVQSYTHCEDSLGSVSWAMSDGAELYMAVATGQDGHTHGCATNTSSCTWDDLHCGEVYTVHVVAMDEMCTSMPSNSTSIRMAPCIPENLKSSLNCTTKVGSLSWNVSETADYYIVTAETNGGHRVQLSTTDTWTFISEFLCGQEYYLSVQAADAVCTSQPSQPFKLKSEPCPPTNVSSVMNCIFNIAVVSWTGSAGAEFYTATLMLPDGQSKSCWSDSAQCSMPNAVCGKNYTVTVVASDKQCDSDPSEADSLLSVPCVPTDVEVHMICPSNQAVVSWSASDGALSYKVTAQSTQGDISACEAEDPMCTLTSLTCGRSYSVQVVAQDDICSSLPSPAIKFDSAPCTPDIGSVVLDCFTNSALLDWAFAEGALHYTATAQSSSGHVSTCHSNVTNCELKNLLCGQTYNVITVASNYECDSPPSASLQLESVPCPPTDVVSVLDCATNTAQVEWQPSVGADSYIVQALGVQEDETGCETESESCILPDLLCGFTYNITVIAVNSVCNVSYSEMKQLQAVPCIPEQVEARVVCESGAVAVSWEPSKGASSYTTVAQGSGGYASTCNSTDTTCVLSDLLCGLNYSITVSASDDTCSSAESDAVNIDTVPCVPQNVTAEMMCSSDTGVVSWEEGEGVSSYKVQATAPDGHKAECYSTESSCQLPNMHCGQMYNLTVTAQDGRCDNSRVYLNLQSAPCIPTAVKASLRCHSNSAAVTWEPSSGALSYTAVGVTADGSHRSECNNTMTYCDLSDLQCGQTYNVSVSGLDESCSSVGSDKAYVRTAPCAPQNVAVHSQCDEGAMTVSWSPNPDAQYFHVAAVSNTGARLYCNSSSTDCTIRNLPCGQSYNVTVLSVRHGCESKPSPCVESHSAPCVPRNPKGRLDCISNSAWVTWDDSAGATSYFALATAGNNHSSNCTSSASPCGVPDLKCGTLYVFHVTAMNKDCNSNHSSTFELETGPCALKSISAVAECNSDTILVEWEEKVDMPLYLVTAEGDDQNLISCNSSSNSCVLEGIQCDMHYSIIVSASSDKCSSLRSPPKKIKTAPCVPDNVTVVPSCQDNGASISWSKSLVATSYQLTATGQDGHVAACTTSVSNCSLAELHCGLTYDLVITATGGNCTSPPATSSFKTVPCAPSSLAVELDCETKSAFMTWNATEGAVEYFSCAQPMVGDAIYCNGSSPSCTLEGLECGTVYNFSVKSSDGLCNGSFSAPLEAGAAPCPPDRVRVRMQRIEHIYWAMVSWDKIDCSDVEYMARVIGKIDNNPEALMNVSSYWLPRPYFEFPMPCSTAYNITVRSRNAAGESEPSSVISGITEPCAPQNVRYSGNTQSAVLYWDASVFATRYTVYNVSGGTRVKLCNTTALSCQLTNFKPSVTVVTASNAVGESNPSQSITGPVGSRRRRDLRAPQVFANLEKDLEIPEVLSVTVSGTSLSVKWTTVKDATEYTLVIEEEQREEQGSQPPIVRSVEGDFYTETDLKPWTTYCIRVAAKNAINQSNYGWPECRNTGAS
ncbi:uncharacterized protein LOC125008801 [Mugil cephalus]|uniref:uncharacterized protein LOC125008801 n=1 Tax=Mugil cephalus TaxID=48193 RepID=UPI001FB60549|nr:uncharacterized protein LOC125008801 [Mugil cephalus]